MFWGDRKPAVSLARRLRAWSLSRFPRRRTVTLTQNRIYILPTGAGAGFCVVLVLLLLLGINYENNLAYALTFLLVSIFVISIIHTYGNLAGLQVSALAGRPCFRGDKAGFTLQLTAAPKRDYEQLCLCWDGGVSQMLDLTEERMTQVELACDAPERGWLDPGPLLVETRFPLGLFRAWTWIDTGLKTLVYPRPVSCASPPPAGGDGGAEVSGVKSRGPEDFQGLARYEKGGSLHQVAWKVYARGQGLHLKQYAGTASEEIWLDWVTWHNGSVEEKLSGICFWALEFHQREQPYGLRLPGLILAPGSGESHRQRVLKALALFGRESQE
ncbi:uncharacterized protein DUF58 [Marinobacterium mangrovicola]|uniref:Uncharacterized protein DUF58 n=1 Tax=Marinobacterium mangrovicola TaxID=1476959 RepID=A0A4R1GQB7_9GAMM|nr:uncharacterized protein DUF58 [Marinobacterium mangrovicola]